MHTTLNEGKYIQYEKNIQTCSPLEVIFSFSTYYLNKIKAGF